MTKRRNSNAVKYGCTVRHGKDMKIEWQAAFYLSTGTSITVNVPQVLSQFAAASIDVRLKNGKIEATSKLQRKLLLLIVFKIDQKYLVFRLTKSKTEKTVNSKESKNA